MKAKILFIDQDQEAIEKAQNLGMPEPKPTERPGEFYFDLELVNAAYINQENCIVIYLPSGYWILEYDEKLWNEIIKRLRIDV